MSRVCQVTGRRTISGNNVSHAKNKNKRVFIPNLKNKRFWLTSENRRVRLTVSAQGIRLIDKKGIEAIVLDIRRRGIKV